MSFIGAAVNIWKDTIGTGGSGGGGGVSPSFLKLNDGTSFLLLNDGVSKLKLNSSS